MNKPELPEPLLEGVEHELWGQNIVTDCYTVDQMRNYGDAMANWAGKVIKSLRETADFWVERAETVRDERDRLRNQVDSLHDLLMEAQMERDIAREERDLASVTLTEDRIDYIADITVRGMEGGLLGFGKTWGWQQFSRALLGAVGCRVEAAGPAKESK